MKYGNVFTTSDYKDALQKTNRNYSGLKTWSQMYAATDLAAQQAESALKYNYAQDVANAYTEASRQEAMVYGSKLGKGYKQASIDDIDAALSEAYNSYRSNYLSSMQNIESSKIATQNQVTDLLTQQAENTKLYEKAHIDYVKDLWSKSESGELTTSVVDKDGNIVTPGDIPADLWERPEWSRFLRKDEKGNVTGLMSDDEIRNLMYDANGNLTLKGLDIYDMIENDLSSSGYKSFGSYLAEQDEANNTNLLEWAASYNPYDYNKAMTNAGSFKELVGMASTDNKYEFIERWGGMTSEDIDTVISKVDSRLSAIDTKINNMTDVDADGVKKEVYGVIDDIEKIANEYGLDISFDEYKKVIDNKFTTIEDLNSAEIADEIVSTTLGAGAIVSGAAAGAAIGSAIPVVGTIIGGLIGGLLGFIGATKVTSKHRENTSAQNDLAKEHATAVRDEVLNMLTYLSMNMKQQQQTRQSNLAFGK